MNYLKVYCNLIRKTENRTPPDGYTEKHHIFPKSIFGNNNRVVSLTAREHYIAHALLEKVYMCRYGASDERTKKMTYAFFLMNSKTNGNDYTNSTLYERCRLRTSEMISKSLKEYYKNNTHHFKGKKVPPERVKKSADARRGIPLSVEHRQLLSEINTGKRLSEETKQKIREARSKQIFTDETTRKRSEAYKQLVWMHDPKNKQNFRINKNKVEEKLADGLVLGRYYVISEETRDKLSKAASLQWQIKRSK
jgi:hypothetical protein